MDGGFPGSNLDKDSRPSDPYPTGRHTRAPERTRKWRPDHGEAIVPSVSMAVPKLGRHLTLSFLKPFRPSVTWARHHDGRAAISSERRSCPSNGPRGLDSRPAPSSEEQSALERLRRRLCGKCVSAHICVMRRFSQVLEASFHCVTFWNHAGLPALPSAAVRHSIADNLTATELLQVCLSPTSPPVFCKEASGSTSPLGTGLQVLIDDG